MSKAVVVMAMYQPKQVEVSELETLVKKHFPMLKEYGLTTERSPFIGRSDDGTIIEMFESATPEAGRSPSDLYEMIP